MKKIISFFLTLTITVLCFPFTVFAVGGEFMVADSVIVVSADASKTDKYAAERLKFYLDKIIGGNMAVVTDDADSNGFEICIGESNRTDNDFSSSADGSYVIISSADKLVISGAGNKGTINGVYAFLEKYCGCHWYESEVTVIPENKNLSVPNGINDVYTPYFEYTETDTASSRDAEFSLANGLTGGVYRDFTQEQGSAVDYIGAFCHTFTTYFCKSETYFEQHPEYFALH